MPKQPHPDIDFLTPQHDEVMAPVELLRARDEERYLKEAQNVLSSYSHAMDLLAEALQNAADAIDARREREPAAPARILITFNTAERTFSVADTGTGMSASDVRLVLTPNISLKAGKLAQLRRGRSRGEKGVGLSFLALASNYLHIETCDGKARQDLEVRNAHEWVLSGGQSARPRATHVSDDADKRLDSDRYTIITVGGVDPEEFDDDLFALAPNDLVWLLRTRTALGNTHYLFERPFNPDSHANDIQILLSYIAKDGKPSHELAIKYAYATPEELLPRSVPVIPLAELKQLDPGELARRLKGAAVRYVQRWRSASGHVVSIYALIVDGADMQAYKSEQQSKGRFFPDEWQGFFIATRDMPTGIRFDVNVVQPRAYLRRIFAILQDDQLVLDLGRKTLHGRTRRMFEAIVESAWQDDLRRIVPRVKSEVVSAEVDQAALNAMIARASNRRDLGIAIPYVKWPTNETSVMAIFHEMVASDAGFLPSLRTLATEVFSREDSLIYAGRVNGNPPLYVLFGMTALDVIKHLESAEKHRAADLAVVWEVGATGLSQLGVQVRAVSERASGATHELLLNGFGGLQEMLPIIVLRAVVEDNP